MPSARELILSGEKRLAEGQHAANARADAEYMLLATLGVSRANLFAHLDEEILPLKAAPYLATLERRVTGEPVQYIIGETEFYGLPFRVTPDVLIPRPETEHLVEKIIELSARFDQPRIADIGAGSGAIAITLAHKLPHARVTAIDISNAALAIAKGNAGRNDVKERIRFLQGDILAPVTAEDFEIIVSNPPYVPTADRDSLSVEVRDFEPGLALFAGEDGLEIYRRLIPAAYAQLVPGGYLALEIGYGQQEAIRALLNESGFADIEFLPDLQQIPRVAVARKP
jgi:release factor glutamine methyltransferase